MRCRWLGFCAVMAIAGCGGGGNGSPPKPKPTRQLVVGDTWNYARTTTTVSGSDTIIDQGTTTWRIASTTFQGQNRLAMNFSPPNGASSMVLRQDTFNLQVDILGTLSSTGTEAAFDAMYLPGTIQAGQTFPTLLISPSKTVVATATVSGPESVTVTAGRFDAFRIEAHAAGIGVTAWVRPGLAAPVKQTTVESSGALTRTTDLQLTGTNVKEK